jgi:putative membrane protein
LYSAIANSVSLADLAIWAGIGIVTQVLANFLAELLTPGFNVEEALEKENVAVAIVLLGMFVSIGLIIAGCMTY